MAYCNMDKKIYIGNGKFGIPYIKPFNETIDNTNFVGFNYARNVKNVSDKSIVHFYLDDYQFESVWNKPEKYISCFRKPYALFSPDFSLYADFPYSVSLYNHYRKHWLANFYQEKGIKIIPSINWSDERSFEYCFEGEPKNSIVGITTNGCLKDKECLKRFYKGYNEMMARLEPIEVLCFTNSIKVGELNLKGNIKFIYASIVSDIKKEKK